MQFLIKNANVKISHPMKKMSVILLLLGLIVIAGCHNDKEEEIIVCTCDFRQINIRAVYTDGTPVILDKFETINLETGQKMEFGMDAYYKDSGQYPVMNEFSHRKPVGKVLAGTYGGRDTGGGTAVHRIACALLKLVEETLLRARETAAESAERSLGVFEVFRIARQQLDGLGHRVVSGPVGGLSGEPAASPGRRSVALSQHEIGNAVLGIQVTGLTRSGGSALDVVGNETHGFKYDCGMCG